MLRELNDVNGASEITAKYASRCLKEFDEELVGAEFGVAYGGGIEKIGKLWSGRGIIYGFDTFSGHPQEIIDKCQDTLADGGKSSHAATCMNPWYSKYGVNELSVDYIRSKLNEQNLYNVNLVKGVVSQDTDLSFIPYLNYCLIDFDYPQSMVDVWNLVKGKIVSGGYLCLHDVVPKGHINGLWEKYQNMLNENLYEVIEEVNCSYISVLRKK